MDINSDSHFNQTVTLRRNAEELCSNTCRQDLMQDRFRTIYNLLAANHLFTVVLLGQLTKRWLNNSTTQTQNQVKSGLCK